jgi:iron complex outermembrane receptor protein
MTVRAGASVGRALLGISTALSVIGAVVPAWAQDVVSSPELAQTSAARDFDIPAQPLTSALVLFGQQSGLQITTDGDLVRNLSTPGVQGRLAPDQALQRLLAGTGLTYTTGSGGTIVLRRPGQTGQLTPGVTQLDPVQVQAVVAPPQAMIGNPPPAYAGGQVATGGQFGLLGNRSVMDAPFNQTNYTAQKVQDQQAKTIKDALIDDPSVRSYLPENGPGFDNIRIRGFAVPNVSTAYGGLFGMLPSVTIMAELAERVEVLKGPSAMLFGMAPGNASIGGTINIVPKRAPDEPLTQLTANYVSAGQFGGHADVARRFGADKQFGVRFNGVFRAGQTDIKGNSDQRALTVLGLDFRGERVRLSSDLGYQYQYIAGLTPYLGVTPGVALPYAPSVRNNPGGQPWAYTERKDLFGVARAEFDLTERITAYAAFGAHDNRIAGLYPVGINATSFSGTATSTAPINTSQYNTYQTAEAGFRASADTGLIGHDFGLTAQGLWSQAGQAVALGTAFASNFYNPTIIARPGIATPVANKTATQDLYSLGIADTLSAAEKRIQLTVGARLQRVTAANFNVTTGAQTSTYDTSALSPSVALLFKPWQNVSVYGNWIQGLQQGTIVAAGFTNAGEVFPPFKSTQYEVGVKVDWGRLTTTASLFQITQPSVITDVATNTQILGGEQRNQGLELNVFGEPVQGVRLLGGMMLLSPVLTKTQGGTTDGWIAPNTPQFTLNLAGEWDLPFVRGLTLNGRAVYTGSQYIDTTWPRRSLPEWTRFDVGARYAFENPGAKGKLLVARFNVENLFDANYWAGGNGATNLFLGAPRTFRLSLTADF